MFGSLCRSTHARLQLVSVPVSPTPLAALLPLSLVPASPPLPVSLAPVSLSMAEPVSPAPVSLPPPPSPRASPPASPASAVPVSLPPPPSLTRTAPPASTVLPLLLLPFPIPHPLVHWPRRQTRGGEHFLPQRPQLSGSAVVLVHTWSLPQKTLVGHSGAPSD